MNITVAGTGYVGLVTGVCFAEVGHNVICTDVDQSKIEMMKQGMAPIYEPGLSELMIKNKDRLTYTTDTNSAYRNADIIFIGVGTPEKKDGSANLTYVYKVAEQIAESVEKECVIVIKSTVPIGTNDKIENYIQSKTKNNNAIIHIASNPEFLSQGTAIYDTMNASRIVIGVNDEYSETILKDVYKKFNSPILVMNRRSAEMVKYASNDFLALKISYINEIANLCEIVGANIDDVSKGMGFDKRIGNQFLNAGIGYGGSCFPKDTKALHWLANYHDYELKTIKAAIEVNENQKLRLIKKAKKYYDKLEGLTVAILGLTFKPNTDDLREAPSLINIPILLEEGVKIKAWDPVGASNTRKIFDNLEYCNSIEETILRTDICFILTEWDEIKRFEISMFEELMNTPIVLDGRNCLDFEKIKLSNLIYEGIGRIK